MVSVLAAAVAVVWTEILRDQETRAERVRCPPARHAAGLVPVGYDEVRGTAPLPLGDVAVLVRNATSRHNLAARVAAGFEVYGFAQAAPPDNDPVYRTDALRCRGQIRFGPQGRAAAHTVSLVAPCLELIRDDRTGATVDVVLGNKFDELSPTAKGRDVLETLQKAESGDHTGGLQSMTGIDAAVPASALTAARAAYC